MSMGGKCWKR